MAKILIVDDGSFTRNYLKYIVESAGHETVGFAEDGAEAIRLYKVLKPDIVTMDILFWEGRDTGAGPETRRCRIHKKPFNTTDIIKEIERAIGGMSVDYRMQSLLKVERMVWMR